MMMGGTLNLHGNRTNSWTKLSKTAEAGSNSIEVLNAAGWRAGDAIVLASTDFDPHQAERRTIAAIRGNTITLDKKLDYMHFGKITFDVDERGEVGMLSRNILIQASPDADQTLFGGHIMAMNGSKMFVDGVELNRMGQNMHLARYPIHWHLIGDAQGQYIKNSAIHDTYSRCVTVHGTNYLDVENNVTYNNIGHCFFLEDGVEHGNQFVHNLGILTKCHPDAPCVATNLAAAGESRPAEGMARVPRTSCFPRTTRRRLSGSPTRTTSTGITWPRVPTRTASGCHCRSTRRVSSKARRSVRRPGRVERHSASSRATSPTPTTTRSCSTGTLRPNGTFSVTGSSHTGLENPADANSKALVSVFEDLTAYKNRNGGIWGRGEMHEFRNVKLADNAMGFTHASGAFGRYAFTSKVIDSLFVGETENVGNPRTDAEKAYGRTFPKVDLPDYPIHGYEYYDYRHDVVNTTFVNFQDNATAQVGSDICPVLCQLRGQLQQRRRSREIRQRQAGVFPADGA